MAGSQVVEEMAAAAVVEATAVAVVKVKAKALEEVIAAVWSALMAVITVAMATARETRAALAMVQGDSELLAAPVVAHTESKDCVGVVALAMLAASVATVSVRVVVVAADGPAARWLRIQRRSSRCRRVGRDGWCPCSKSRWSLPHAGAS